MNFCFLPGGVHAIYRMLYLRIEKATAEWGEDSPLALGHDRASGYHWVVCGKRDALIERDLRVNCMFMWTGDTHSGQDPKIPKKGIGAIWIAIPVIAFLLVAAWHYGILASAALILKDVVVSIRNMLHDMAAVLRDFWQYLLRQRQ